MCMSGEIPAVDVLIEADTHFRSLPDAAMLPHAEVVPLFLSCQQGVSGSLPISPLMRSSINYADLCQSDG